MNKNNYILNNPNQHILKINNILKDVKHITHDIDEMEIFRLWFPTLQWYKGNTELLIYNETLNLITV